MFAPLGAVAGEVAVGAGGRFSAVGGRSADTAAVAIVAIVAVVVAAAAATGVDPFLAPVRAVALATAAGVAVVVAPVVVVVAAAVVAIGVAVAVAAAVVVAVAAPIVSALAGGLSAARGGLSARPPLPRKKSTPKPTAAIAIPAASPPTNVRLRTPRDGGGADDLRSASGPADCHETFALIVPSRSASATVGALAGEVLDAAARSSALSS